MVHEVTLHQDSELMDSRRRKLRMYYSLDGAPLSSFGVQIVKLSL